ncbi:MAG: hypothetical protein WBP16_00825 [Ferruginibacter sp.]
MQPGKKKITALGFLLLLALPLFFSVGIFIKQKVLQHQRRQRFDTELLQTILVSPENLVWVKPGKEILHEGKLFDVKYFKTTGNKIMLTGFYDHKEDKLVKHIKDLIHKKNDSDNSTSRMAVKFLFYPKFKEVNIISVQNSWQLISKQFPVYEELISSLSYPVPAPPPKFS